MLVPDVWSAKSQLHGCTKLFFANLAQVLRGLLFECLGTVALTAAKATLCRVPR
jgi:hypothetical protein